MNPLLRFQVLFDNDMSGSPTTKEFKAGNLAEPTFDALSTHVFAMSHPNECMDQFDMTFKYRIEERHGTRWVNFQDTEGLGYAMETNQDKSYVYISATIVKKGSAPMALDPSLVPPSPPVSSKRAAANDTTKPKVVAKKARVTKPKASSSRGSSKVSLDQKILIALKTLLSLGIMTPPRVQVAMFTGHAFDRSFGTILSKLSKSALVEYPDSKTVRLTPAGIAKMGTVTAPANNEVVHDKIRELLKGREVDIFNLLLDGRTRLREEVMNTLGFTNAKSFGTYLSNMSSRGFLEYVKESDGTRAIRLADIAFPVERPNGNV